MQPSLELLYDGTDMSTLGNMLFSTKHKNILITMYGINV